ncbi:SpaA isopeptide-forming pilin-related protein [Eubacterium sp. AF22-9]|uniref:SpaA isopeptide-forming pilin-related protein n=1 Tax=Eubacterium sp. AF22-9 TaxID=2292233 RepID=UPI0024E1A50E|nr:SpaA isopeptide-forming pilin-related protein [Eubacterium sp. AF22-9]
MYLEDESHSYHISTGSIVINKDGEFVTDITLMKGYWYDFIFNFFKDSLAGVTFDVYAKEDIVSADGLDTVYHKAGDKVATIVTNDKGIARIDDLPLGQYYVKEIEAPKGYVKSDKIFDVDASYQGDKVKVIEFEAAFENAPIKVEISKTDITGEKELPGAKLSVIDADGKLVESWTSEAGKTHMIERLPVGKYTLREESAPYGYKVASDVTFEVKETAEIQKVSMKDEQAVGKIVIEKTDKVTGKPIDGVVFEVRDKDGKVLDTLTTDKNGHAESKELPICTYNEDGSFKEDIHYTVVETKAADGYILDETAHDVTLRYDDNAPDVVVTTLKLINVPTEPKLPQTGDNANPLLYLGIGALALITGVGVGLRGRKKKNKQ